MRHAGVHFAMQFVFTGAGVVRFVYRYENDGAGVATAASVQSSTNLTSTLGESAAQLSSWQLTRVRVSAIVSPASGEYVATEFLNATPVVGAPAYAAVKALLRPCDTAVAGGTGGAWQPLHFSSWPGMTCSQF